MGTVDDYLAELAPVDAVVVARIYAVAREEAPAAQQGTGYGMPALVLNGKPLLSVMRTKQHVAVYPFSATVIEALADDLTDVDSSKGTIRFQPEHPLPDELVRALVRARAAQIDNT